VKGSEIRIGSRGSALALAQARLVLQALDADGRPSRIVTVETDGDRRAPDTAWGEGAFVAAIERALLMGRVDVAVHSAKDVPTDEDPRLRIGAYLPRADARDALVVRAGADACGVDDLPAGARVGTDSPRRTGFLLARRPDLALHPLHGNVDTRLRRLDSGETDALILACAGLDRLGLGDRIAERISPEIAPPAPGQGAIALQIRRDDARMIALTAAIDHRPTRMAVEAERAFLAASGGGCRSPIGALAVLEGGELMLLGGHARPDGSATALGRRRGTAADAEAMGRELALELDTRMSRRDIATGAAARKTTRSRVIVTRAAEQSHALAKELDDVGLEPVIVPTIAVELEPPGGELDQCLQRLDDYRWIVCTSANGARAILAAASSAAIATRLPCWAAIGPATRRVLEGEGIQVDFQPSESSASALSQELPIRPQDGVLVVRGDLADQELAVTLRARGASVDDVVAYRTREAPEESRIELRRAMTEGPIAAVLFTSGSSLRGLLALGNAESFDVRSIPCVCIGPETALEARAAGFRVLAISPSPESAALAATCALALAAHPQETS
jgi:hydroxymethylbilane synthase